MFKAIYNLFHHHYHARYHGIYRHAKKLFVFDLGLLALALFMLGAGIFFFFWKPGLVDYIDLSISLGKNRIKSGETVRLTVDYSNRSKFVLSPAILSVRLPEGFVIDRQRTPESSFSKNSTFNLVKLEPGAKGQVEIYGRLWTEPKKEENIIATVSYEPVGINRTEQKITAFLASFSESVLETNLQTPSSTFTGQPVPYSLTLTNTSDEKIGPLNLASNWTSANKESFPADFYLPAHTAKLFTGLLTAPGKSGEATLTITPQVLVNNHLINQSSAEKTISILSAEISSSARLIGSATYAEPGQTLPVEITWNNNSKINLENLRLRLNITPGTVDLRATAKDNRLKLVGGLLTADSSTRTALANGKTGSSDTFIINLKLLPTFSIGQTDNQKFEIKPIMEAAVSGMSGQVFNQPGATLSIPLATEMSLRGETRYYTDEGDQLGRGPLPPRVGETTKYWIFAQVFNGTNAVRDASFRTSLPVGVEFTGKQSVTIGPQLQYNSKDRSIAWSYSELPANSETGVYFEVAVNPTPEQIGKSLQLTNNLYFTATDNVVGKTFSLSHGGLTNVLTSLDRGSRSNPQVAAQ